MSIRPGLIFLCATLAATAMIDARAADASILAGSSVEIVESSDGNVHAVGGKVELDAPVGGSARLAGGTVEIGANAAIAEGASLAAGKIIVKGAIKGDLRAAAGHVTLDGTVGGDASVAAGTLELGPNARIGGKLRFRGGQMERDPAAQVAGGVEHASRRSHKLEYTPFSRSRGGWIWTAGLVLLAAIIAGSLPALSTRMGEELRTRPWMAALFGLVALVVIPIASILVMITIIGIPIALLALMAYAALLIVGYVFASVVASGLLLERVKPEVAGRPAWRAGAAVLAMLALALLGRIPVLGALVIFVALIVGVGLIVHAIIRRVRPEAPPPPSPAPA
jgi:hypothetical protein